MDNPKYFFIGLVSLCMMFFPACNPSLQDLPSHNSVIHSARFKDGVQIIPDAELPYSPAQVGFDVAQFIEQQNGYLRGYIENINEEALSGAQIIDEISLYYSVNPRLLLAVLEYQAGLVSEKEPAYKGNYPILKEETSYQGLFKQLSWLANTLNRGFYLHEVGALPSVTLTDGKTVTLPQELNDASAALYYLFSLLFPKHEWELAVSPLGFFADYVRLFGDPFQYEEGALLPEGLEQPTLQLPFAQGERWHYTSGPHSAWGDGAAWAALDFSPPGENFGCFVSDNWVRAMAEGVIGYAKNGVVLEDLDGDGDVHTGWVLLYMHIAQDGRVLPGTHVQAGDALGHPSCEGGPASGTHMHIARRYNGVWIAADRDLPFLLSGWRSAGLGVSYEGTLTLNDKVIDASEYLSEENEISW